MQIVYVGHGISFTPALEELVERKLKRAFSSFDVSEVRVTITKSGAKQSFAIHLVNYGQVIDSRVSGDNVYKILDKGIARSRSQLVKAKEKRQD